MRRMRGFWFAAALVPAVFAGVVYLQAGAQSAPERQPLITEALVDAENATLTINGYDFSAGVPTVTLGMRALPVLSAGESEAVTELPELPPGAYLLAATWPRREGRCVLPDGRRGSGVPVAAGVETPRCGENGGGAAG